MDVEKNAFLRGVGTAVSAVSIIRGPSSTEAPTCVYFVSDFAVSIKAFDAALSSSRLPKRPPDRDGGSIAHTLARARPPPDRDK
ncbi:hypothetical protein EVAR_67692_1 [Eumeta japonica]|uniref:Uncharacterized protein n=1 Tax=Eumeta variegata TaxID=151549 RepID=A0A4C1ZHW4_EUMVA|nr:hypothetical protein EVAR_67692_1 [Eumeta japonica]